MLRSLRQQIALSLFLIFIPFSVFSETLRILHFNDTYEIMPVQDGPHMIGGFAQLKTLIHQQKKGNAHTLVTFGGDIRPATVDGNPVDSLDMIDVLNDVGVDVAVFGNHEFDEGDAMTRQFIKQAKFPWICTNVLEKNKTPYGGSPRYEIRQVGRYKIGLIGLLTPETTSLSAPDEGVFFASVVETAQATAIELKAQGVDVIIAMTHLSLHEDKELAAKVPEIDLIVGGHEHEPTTMFIAGTMIHKSGNNGEYLGVVDLEISKTKEGVHVLPEWKMIPVRKVQADPGLNKKILALRDKAQKEYDQPLALTEVSLDTRKGTVRSRPAPLASLVADAMRTAMKADVALINGGSLRGNNNYPAGSKLLLKHLANELAFSNTLVVREITGQQLKEVLEAALQNAPAPSGSYPHISGFEVVYDSAKPKGQKVLSMKRNGNEIQATDKIALATTNFLAAGGDGLPDLSHCKGKDSDIIYGDAAKDYLIATAVIKPDILEPRVVEKS